MIPSVEFFVCELVDAVECGEDVFALGSVCLVEWDGACDGELFEPGLRWFFEQWDALNGEELEVFEVVDVGGCVHGCA